jgi:hypothetical protein
MKAHEEVLNFPKPSSSNPTTLVQVFLSLGCKLMLIHSVLLPTVKPTLQIPKWLLYRTLIPLSGGPMSAHLSHALHMWRDYGCMIFVCLRRPKQRKNSTQKIPHNHHGQSFSQVIYNPSKEEETPAVSLEYMYNHAGNCKASILCEYKQKPQCLHIFPRKETKKFTGNNNCRNVRSQTLTLEFICKLGSRRGSSS